MALTTDDSALLYIQYCMNPTSKLIMRKPMYTQNSESVKFETAEG